MKRSKWLWACAAAAVCTAALPAFAHHSFALFDIAKAMTLEGAVKEFQWTNPHIWVQLIVHDPATGKDVEWSIEGGSPAGLSRQGWTRHSLKVGDKATVEFHPLKAGGPGGSLMSVTVNGVTLGGKI
jgi:hypothetical protein